METVLDFFSDLILFTAGLAVLTGWIILIMLASVEAFDMLAEKYFPSKTKKTPLKPEED